MHRSTTLLRGLAAALAVSLLAGCAQQAAPPPPHDAATSGPELAGAWYQIYFDTGSSEINARGQMITKKVADVVTNNLATRVTVIGRTDRVGAAPANMALSQRRANAVRDALIAAGVPGERIDTSWIGEGKAMVTAADDAATPRNRVVDVTVVKEP
jgi:OOP family OmpA-OmpF porin